MQGGPGQAPGHEVTARSVPSRCGPRCPLGLRAACAARRREQAQVRGGGAAFCGAAAWTARLRHCGFSLRRPLCVQCISPRVLLVSKKFHRPFGREISETCTSCVYGGPPPLALTHWPWPRLGFRAGRLEGGIRRDARNPNRGAVYRRALSAGSRSSSDRGQAAWCSPCMVLHAGCTPPAARSRCPRFPAPGWAGGIPRP